VLVGFLIFASMKAKVAKTESLPPPHGGWLWTRFRFDPRLTPLDAEPRDSIFANHAV